MASKFSSLYLRLPQTDQDHTDEMDNEIPNTSVKQTGPNEYTMVLLDDSHKQPSEKDTRDRPPRPREKRSKRSAPKKKNVSEDERNEKASDSDAPTFAGPSRSPSSTRKPSDLGDPGYVKKEAKKAWPTPPSTLQKKTKSMKEGKEDESEVLDGDFKKLRQITKQREQARAKALSVSELLFELKSRRQESAVEERASGRFNSLFHTVETGDKTAVQQELSRLQTVESRGFLVSPAFRNPENQETALHRAIAQGKVDTARVLLEYGGPDLAQAEMQVEVSATLTQVTPLHLCAQYGHVDLTRHILVDIMRSSTDRQQLMTKTTLMVIEGQRPRDMNILHIAALNGCLQTVELWKQFKLTVNTQNRKKDIPLLMAVRSGNLEMVRLLLNHGANINHRNDKMSSPLHWAVRYGYIDIVKELLKNHADVHIKRSLGFERPIICASALGYTDILEVLLANGANPNHTVRGGQNSLHFAASSGHVDVVKVLLKTNLHCDAQDSNGNTPLFTAALHGHCDVLRELLRVRASITHRNNDGETVWDAAVKCPHVGCLHVLLTHVTEARPPGFEITQSSIKFPPMMSPLHLASAAGDVQKLDYLLEAGVDVTSVDTNGNNFLHTAALHDQAEVLAKYGNSTSLNAGNSEDETCLHVACRCGSMKSVDVIVPKSVLNKPNKAGRTPLHIAAGAPGTPDHLPFVLLTQMTKKYTWSALEHMDAQGNTALHLAAQYGTATTIRNLKTLSFRAQNELGNTPLHLALMKRNEATFTAMLEIIKQSGSVFDINTENKANETVLVTACRMGNLPAIRQLIDCGADLAHRDATKDAVLHSIIHQSSDDPNYQFLEDVLTVISEESAKWLCNYLKLRFPSENEDKVRDYRTLAMTILIHNVIDAAGYSALRLAAECGAADALRTMLNMPHVSVYETESYGHVKREFDITDVTPDTLTPDAVDISTFPGAEGLDRKSLNALEALSTLETDTHQHKKSILELIVQHNDDEEKIAEMLDISPIIKVVDNYFGGYQTIFLFLIIIHIVYMGLFSAYSIPKLPVYDYPNGTNITSADSVSVAALSIWPACIAVYFIILAAMKIRYYCRPRGCPAKTPRGIKDASPVAAIGDVWKWLCDNIITSSLLGLTFCVCSLVWIVLWHQHNTSQDYVLAVALAFGWLYTISFTQAFQSIHSLSLMLKSMIVKDVFRFLFIYMFILFAFTFAIQALITASHRVTDNYKSGTLMYVAFLWMLGMADFFSEEEEGYLESVGRNVPVLRAVYLLYIILTAIVLLNLLIAIMNDSYSDLEHRRGTLWKIDSLRMALEFENFCLVNRGCIRCFRHMSASRNLRYDEERQRYLLSVPREVQPPSAADAARLLAELRADVAALKLMVAKQTPPLKENS